MDKYELFKQFISKRKTFKAKDYLIATILYNIAPTILEGKPGTMVNLSNINNNLHSEWHKYKHQLFPDNGSIKYFELRRNASSTLVLFYNPKQLEKTIFNENNFSFLMQFNYNRNMTLYQCLEKLKERFCFDCPHECGIFLGYPLEDIKYFIKYSGKKCLMCGYWKVYHNVAEARQLFSKYDQSKIKMLRSILNGPIPYSYISYEQAC